MKEKCKFCPVILDLDNVTAIGLHMILNHPKENDKIMKEFFQQMNSKSLREKDDSGRA